MISEPWKQKSEVTAFRQWLQWLPFLWQQIWEENTEGQELKPLRFILCGRRRVGSKRILRTSRLERRSREDNDKGEGKQAVSPAKEERLSTARMECLSYQRRLMKGNFTQRSGNNGIRQKRIKAKKTFTQKSGNNGIRWKRIKDKNSNTIDRLWSRCMSSQGSHTV